MSVVTSWLVAAPIVFNSKYMRELIGKGNEKMRFGPNLLRRHWITVLWLFIGLVSLFDGFLVVRFRDVILEVEQNPVGALLLDLDHGSPGLFLRTKAAGTLLVLSALIGLYRY